MGGFAGLAAAAGKAAKDFGDKSYGSQQAGGGQAAKRSQQTDPETGNPISRIAKKVGKKVRGKITGKSE